MKCNHSVCFGIGVLTAALYLCPSASSQISVEATDAKSGKFDSERPIDASHLHNPQLWHDPGIIAALDLYHGHGSYEGQPVTPFKFLTEDKHGTNPKFDARDANGKKWRVKLGDEARPEVVASRMLWAMGYFVNDDYVVASAQVEGLHLERGEKWIRDGKIEEARFEKIPDEKKKVGTWRWRDNPFLGTREFNGLRVMMAVMNNWDLKDVNNAVYFDKISGQEIFMARDIGATFGTNGLSWTKDRSKGDAETFRKSKFIISQSGGVVNFGTPAAPMPLLAVNAKQFQMRRDLEWIGEQIPIADARWMGSMLKQLSHGQLVDAFRAGHFPPDDISKYVHVVEDRIQELSAL